MVVLLAGSSAFGQFLVQPMKLQIPVQPAKRIPREVILENLSRTTTETIGLRLVDVTQDPNGVWKGIAPGDPNVDVSTLRSCRSWLRLEKDTVEVAPFGREAVRLWIEVPSGTRGFYFAAIIAQSQVRVEEVEGYVTMMILEFVIPIILEVQGYPMHHQVELTDVGLEFLSQTESREAASLVTLDIANKGGTYSRLVGLARVWGWWGGHWRKVTDARFIDTGIIPGVKLHLRADVERPLPSGKYKVEGFLYVDGRRSGQVTRELEFAGDTRIVSAKAGAALDVDPPERTLDVIPGATRVTSVAVMNASEEAVTVNAELVLPNHMNGIRSALGVAGEEFGCAGWVTLEPQQFTLNARGRQVLRIVARMPASGTALPNYYGTIRLQATYPDGQKAGLVEARLVVQNPRAQSSPRMDNIVFTMQEASPSRYFVVARFLNNGDTHVMPVCSAVLTNVSGDMVYKRFILSSEAFNQTGMLLPLDTRNFSGTLDVSDVPPGTYRLTAIVRYGKGDSAQSQTALDVVEQGGGKAVQVRDLGAIGGRVTIPL